MQINTMKLIEEYKTEGKINPRYDATVRSIDDIYKNSCDTFNLICNAFVFGYAQGTKAAGKRVKQ